MNINGKEYIEYAEYKKLLDKYNSCKSLLAYYKNQAMGGVTKGRIEAIKELRDILNGIDFEAIETK